MQYHLLIDKAMEPIPESIKVVMDFGDIFITTANPHMYSSGRHVIIDGDKKDIREWLKPFDDVWVGVGSPCLQEFVVMHIKE